MADDAPDFFPDELALETQVREVAEGILRSTAIPRETKKAIVDSCISMVQRLVPKVNLSYSASVAEPRHDVERTNSLIMDYHTNVQAPFMKAMLFELVQLRVLAFKVCAVKGESDPPPE